MDKITTNSKIYQFHKVDNLCIGIELEMDDFGNEFYTYYLFVKDSPTLIMGKGSPENKYNLTVLHDLTTNWNFWTKIMKENNEKKKRN